MLLGAAARVAARATRGQDPALAIILGRGTWLVELSCICTQNKNKDDAKNYCGNI
jgi:hypothetical protein